MKTLKLAFVICAMLVMLLPVRTGAAVIVEENEVLPFLERMIDWHRQIGSLEVTPQLPRAQLMKNAALQSGTKALRYSFEFAHVVAEIYQPAATAKDQPPANGRGQNMARAIERAQKDMLQLQTELARAPNAVKREAVRGELRLKEEHIRLLQAIAENLKAPVDEDATLVQKIDRLADAVPEMEHAKPGPYIEAAPTAAAAYLPASTGIWALSSDIYSFMQTKREIKKLRNDTDKMYQQNREKIMTIRDEVQALLKQGSDMADSPNAASRKEYEALLSNFKQLSKTVIALSRMNMALQGASQSMTEWVSLNSQHLKELFQRLLLRVSFLSFAVLLAIGLSIAAHRATHHYVTDIRLQRHLKIARRIVFSIAMVLIFFVTFFTDFSSLAMFAGLLTAGVAVAMQNIIMSFFAYFYLFGKFGIRAGDRVSVLGVTGKVIQVSMLRFQLLELERSSRGYYPTGRTIGFSNAILFQPTPFIRETPGTNFVWSKISLKLEATIDYHSAYKKLSDCVMKVYEGHSDIIKHQEAALQNVTDFKTEISVPQTYLKITDGGLLMTIRYAVHREHEPELQEQMTEALLKLIRSDPELKFVNIN